ncbi:MAG: helix-turn-helix transcriptional regulator [Sulfurimonas sp.]|jgi:predicted transcriptional regulator|uniref:helix-turn-helix domain-containing protein n=1 Tax=Sulfurimonas sp. TaxID=2022749 RepID=UPI003563CA4D
MDNEHLVATLRELEITKTDLAKLTGVSKASVSRWAAGSQPIPKWLESWLALSLKLKNIENMASLK